MTNVPHEVLPVTLETIATAICAVAIPLILIIHDAHALYDEPARKEDEHP